MLRAAVDTLPAWRDGLACGHLHGLAHDVPVDRAHAEAEAMVAELARELGIAMRIAWAADNATADESHGEILLAG